MARPDGGNGPAAAAGDGTYTIGLPTADATFGFDASDVNRNFVGYLRLDDAVAPELDSPGAMRAGASPGGTPVRRRHRRAARLP